MLGQMAAQESIFKGSARRMARITVVISITILLGLIATATSYATTWYVTEDGSGDAPSIEAAMDSASCGDTVLVGPGIYKVFIDMADGVTLRSEKGPAETVLTGLWTLVRFGKLVSGTLEGFTLAGVPEAAAWEHGVVECLDAYEVHILGNVITNSARHGIYCDYCLDGVIGGNTIADPFGDGAYFAILVDRSYPMDIHHNICVGYPFGIGVRESMAIVRCNDSWDNGHDYWPQAPGDPPWPWGSNISLDPLFCDREHWDFTLNACSPCLPGNHPGGASCLLIGALGKGCYDPSRAEPIRWTTIKTLFR
jgi:hypothetical protein